MSGDVIEINLNDINVFEKGEKGQRTELRTVKRGGKVFQRKTRVGRKDEKPMDIPKISDISFDLFADDVKDAIDDKGVDTISEMDDIDIGYYITDFVPEEYSLRYGTEKLRDEFEEKLLEAFKNKYQK